MKIERILNNNVVLVLDDLLQETVVMGKSIGLNKQVGDSIPIENIDKIFHLNSPFSGHISALVDSVPPLYLEIVRDIILHAQLKFEMDLHDSIFIALIDYLKFAMQRAENGLLIENSLLWEIEKDYPKEYLLGKYAISIIQQKTGLGLSDGEAGFIALHLVNAQAGNHEQPMNPLKIFINDIIELMKNRLSTTFKEDTLVYRRFVTHLRFLGQQILENKGVKAEDGMLPKQVWEECPNSVRCSKLIKKYIENHYKQSITDDEMLFLTIHIEHLLRYGINEQDT
ncbi:PRD domain-containing protein [Serratia bockelmannii]|uniref:PRD domain-containing protein n=1 Tax=Serratia bockelmannii TaxID=2703793 RepID=UPI003FA6ED2F